MLLETCGLTKEYALRSLFSKPVISCALASVHFQIDARSVTALVGPSGSGKSTLARCLAGLEPPTRGVVTYRGTDISRMTKAQRRQFRRNVQIVFQDAAGSINPRFTAAAAVSEPLRIAGIGNRQEQTQVAVYWMEQVGLCAALATRPALELSGGERQRLALARSLVSTPEVIIFDESFSALDLPLANRILSLLERLRASYGFTYLLIGHNLILLAKICQCVAVMHGGRIVERQSMGDFLSASAHAWSRELIQTVPRLSERRHI